MTSFTASLPYAALAPRMRTPGYLQFRHLHPARPAGRRLAARARRHPAPAVRQGPAKVLATDYGRWFYIPGPVFAAGLVVGLVAVVTGRRRGTQRNACRRFTASAILALVPPAAFATFDCALPAPAAHPDPGGRGPRRGRDGRPKTQFCSDCQRRYRSTRSSRICGVRSSGTGDRRAGWSRASAPGTPYSAGSRQVGARSAAAPSATAPLRGSRVTSSTTCWQTSSRRLRSSLTRPPRAHPRTACRACPPTVQQYPLVAGASASTSQTSSLLIPSTSRRHDDFALAGGIPSIAGPDPRGEFARAPPPSAASIQCSGGSAQPPDASNRDGSTAGPASATGTLRCLPGAGGAAPG